MAQGQSNVRFAFDTFNHSGLIVPRKILESGIAVLQPTGRQECNTKFNKIAVHPLLVMDSKVFRRELVKN